MALFLHSNSREEKETVTPVHLLEKLQTGKPWDWNKSKKKIVEKHDLIT